MKVTKHLVVTARGDMRIITRRPNPGQLRHDEVAFKIEVSIPDTWGKVQPDVLELTMPDPPEGAVLRWVPEDGDTAP